MGFPRQDYCRWEGCHFLLQGIFLTQASNPHLLCLLCWQADSLSTEPSGKPLTSYLWTNISICIFFFPSVFLSRDGDTLKHNRRILTSPKTRKRHEMSSEDGLSLEPIHFLPVVPTCVWMLSCIRLFVTTWTVVCQAPPSREFSR